MNSYISDIYDFDSMCKTISREMDLPDSFYSMDYGTGNSSQDVYFRIRGKTFASSPMRQKDRGIRFKKNAITMDAMSQFDGFSNLRIMQIIGSLDHIIEYTQEYGVVFGLDCPYYKTYWAMYRLIYTFAEKLGIESFGCCSRYDDCSDKMICTQPNKELRYDCIYRKNLFENRIFYGMNRNNI